MHGEQALWFFSLRVGYLIRMLEFVSTAIHHPSNVSVSRKQNWPRCYTIIGLNFYATILSCFTHEKYLLIKWVKTKNRGYNRCKHALEIFFNNIVATKDPSVWSYMDVDHSFRDWVEWVKAPPIWRVKSSGVRQRKILSGGKCSNMYSVQCDLQNRPVLRSKEILRSLTTKVTTNISNFFLADLFCISGIHCEKHMVWNHHIVLLVATQITLRFWWLQCLCPRVSFLCSSEHKPTS